MAYSNRVKVPELRKQWDALMNEDLTGLPKEALIASIKSLASELMARTKDNEQRPSNLVNHARQEFELLGNMDTWFVEGCINVIQTFADMGHSGGSASVAIPVINELLQHKNLSPLTDNPDEWIHHDEDIWGEPGGIWQNRRNSEAFSNDGGKTYHFHSESSGDKDCKPIHYSNQYIKGG